MRKKQKKIKSSKKDQNRWSTGSKAGGGTRKEHGKPAVRVYTAAQSILILGDGDFSFCAGLVKHTGGEGGNIVATSLDTRSECVKKYGSSAKKCIDACEKAGATVRHGIDATALHGKFTEASFHRCIFNFPHTGEQRVHSNQAMLRDFFKSARPLLKVGGEVHITLKMAPPYSEWDVPAIAQSAGSGAAGKTVTLMFRRTQQAEHGPQGASTKSSLSLQVSAPIGGARDATAAAHGGNLDAGGGDIARCAHSSASRKPGKPGKVGKSKGMGKKPLSDRGVRKGHGSALKLEAGSHKADVKKGDKALLKKKAKKKFHACAAAKAR